MGIVILKTPVHTNYMHGDEHTALQFGLTKGVNMGVCVRRKGKILLPLGETVRRSSRGLDN